MIMSLYNSIEDLKDRLPDSYLQILKSLGRDYNIPGDISHNNYCNYCNYCNRLC